MSNNLLSEVLSLCNSDYKECNSKDDFKAMVFQDMADAEDLVSEALNCFANDEKLNEINSVQLARFAINLLFYVNKMQ